MNAPQEPPLRILYIAGFGRSGSTLLDNILGQIPGFFSVGELSYLPDRGLRDGLSCACGERFGDCRVWVEIVERAFAGDQPDLDEMVAARESLTPRGVVRDALLGRHPFGHEPHSGYVRNLGKLYRAVQAVSGARVIVDSSKAPSYAWALQQIPGVELRIAHLVRDPRAVAYSWSQDKVYDERTGMKMTVHPPAASAKLWTTWNLATEALWNRRNAPAGSRYFRMRYEDFADAPRDTVRDLVEFAGAPVEAIELPFTAPHVARMRENHAFAGNPSRFRSGEIEIRADEKWRTRAGGAASALVTALAGPVAFRYGY